MNTVETLSGVPPADKTPALEVGHALGKAWPLRFLLARAARFRSELLYAAAAASYIAFGLFVTEFLLSWIVAFAWLLLWTWGLPALFRLLRR